MRAGADGALAQQSCAEQYGGSRHRATPNIGAARKDSSSGPLGVVLAISLAFSDGVPSLATNVLHDEVTQVGPKNMFRASAGEQIIGSPRRLSEVLSTTPLPVSFSSSSIRS
jgi:hypothetical protein